MPALLTHRRGILARAAAAFGAAALLDDFNRANASTLGANWTTYIFAFTLTRSHDVSSNQCYATGTGTFQQDYWNAANFGPDVEVVATIAALPTQTNDGIGLFARLTTIGAGTTDGYGGYALREAAGTYKFVIRRYDDAVQSADLATGGAGTTIAVGDKLGFEAIGSTLKVWHYVAASGTWVERASLVDATYSAAGKVGITSVREARLDDFSAATR